MNMIQKKIIMVSSCVLIDFDGRILLALRPEGKLFSGYWEFPGGKIEPNETPEKCLQRELKEELGINISSHCIAPVNFSTHSYNDFDLLLLLYICRKWEGHPKNIENNHLEWIKPSQLINYPMPPANKNLIPFLQDLL
jgi:8-oxo-dGTP diphosphatase